MITPLADRRRKARLSRIVYIAIFCLVSVAIIIFALPRFAGGVAHFFARPFWKGEQSIETSITASEYVLQTKKTVFRENEILKKENESLKNRLMNYEVLSVENTTLKELFHRTATRNLVLASVLARPDRSLYDTLVLDVGSRDGVVIGDKVFVDGTIYIGTIREVYTQTSVAVLFSSPNEVTEGIVTGVGVHAELTGRGGGSFEVVVPRDLVFAPGMTIASSTIDASVLATIEKVISDPRDPFQKLIGTSPVNMYDIGWVQIEKTQE